MTHFETHLGAIRLNVVLSGITAFAFTFPLFLAMRQRRLTERAAAEARSH